MATMELKDPASYLERRLLEEGIKNPAEREVLKNILLKELNQEVIAA